MGFGGLGGIVGSIAGLAGGPVGSAIGGAIGHNIDQREAIQQQNDANTLAAQTQMNFQKYMSNTSHQREVQDLQAAGLNPVLSAGGSGSSTPTGAAPALDALPTIQLPDLMAYGVSLKQLEQTDQRLAIDKQNSAAGIAKSLSETELNKMKKVLLNKGMIRAELEGEASSVLRNIIKFFKDSVRKPNLNHYQNNRDFYDTDVPLPQ